THLAGAKATTLKVATPRARCRHPPLVPCSAHRASDDRQAREARGQPADRANRAAEQPAWQPVSLPADHQLPPAAVSDAADCSTMRAARTVCAPAESAATQKSRPVRIVIVTELL